MTLRVNHLAGYVGLLAALACGGNTAAIGHQLPAKIPLEIYENTPFVQVRVNGSEPLSFLVDSGADTCVIDSRRATALSLSVRGQAHGTGFGDTPVAIAFARGVSLTLGDVTLSRQTVVVYPFAELEPVLGRRIDGVMGRNLFEQFVVELDYVAHVLTLYDRKAFLYTGAGTRLPISFDDELPLIPGTVSLAAATPGLVGKFLVDTGANDHLDLNSGFVSKHRVLDVVAGTIPTSGSGANGDSRGRSGRLAVLQLGPYRVVNPISGISQATQGVEADADRSGRIGGSILSRFRLLFDYTRKVLFLEPNEHFAEPFEMDMSGVRLVAGGAAFDIFTVREVREDSPGQRAGLRPGDAIVAIDGVSTSKYTLQEVRAMFRRDGVSYSLSVLRGGTPSLVSLTMHRVI